MEVTIYQGSEFKIEITAGEHVIKNISSKISNEVLKLDNNNKCNFVRGYKKTIKVKITAPYLVQVTNYGVGPITIAEGFQQDKIFIKAENSGDTYMDGTFDEIRTSSHGNGDMYLKGVTKRLLVYSNGTNFTRAEDLVVSDYIFISTYSIGDAFLNLKTSATIDYYIWSEGNIYYQGNPASIKNLSEINAKGKLIQKD